MTRCLALALILLVAAPAYAALDCKKAETQMEMEACAGKSLDAADRKLNAIYTKLMKQLGSADKRKLRQAQRAWIAYRDAQCAFNASGSEGGTIQPTIILDCKEDLTNAQIEILDEQLNCEEGDLGCAH